MSAPRRIRLDLTVREEITMVELLTWTYRRQKADLMTAKPLHLPEAPAPTPPPAWSRDGCVAVARDALLGARIPTTAAAQRPTLHPDADAVHDRVVARSIADPLGAMLLLRHGRSGEPPTWGAEIPRPEPVTRHRDGREEIIEDATLPGQSHLERRRPAKGVAAAWVEVFHPYCPLEYWPSVAVIDQTRLEYAMWRAALVAVFDVLPPLKRWVIRDIGAPSEPWAAF